MNLPGLSATPLRSLSDQDTNGPTPEELLQSAVTLAEEDMRAVDATIQTRLESDIALIRTLGAYTREIIMSYWPR